MATVNQTLSPAVSPRGEAAQGAAQNAPACVLRCLVISSDPSRRRLIRAAAEAQAWEAIMCRDAGEFLRQAFKRCVPLVVVDLPDVDASDYSEVRGAVQRVKELQRGLLAVCGGGPLAEEEVWARSLGAWIYLNAATRPDQLRVLFGEARLAIARMEDLQPPQPASEGPRDGQGSTRASPQDMNAPD